MTTPMPLHPDRLYFVGDRTVCGLHAGHTAQHTRHGLHGEPVDAVTAQDRAEWATYCRQILTDDGDHIPPLCCETCNHTGGDR